MMCQTPTHKILCNFGALGLLKEHVMQNMLVRLEDIHHNGDYFDMGLCLLNLETTSESVGSPGLRVCPLSPI